MNAYLVLAWLLLSFLVLAQSPKQDLRRDFNGPAAVEKHEAVPSSEASKS